MVSLNGKLPLCFAMIAETNYKKQNQITKKENRVIMVRFNIKN